MPDYYREATSNSRENVVFAKIFRLREGLACVVSWASPEAGLRVFNPTADDPDTPSTALPYAHFVREHLMADKVVVEMEDSVEWNDAWGTLIG